MNNSSDTTSNPALRPKAAGETKVVAMITHDAFHNGVMQERALRSIFGRNTDWRFIVARSTSAFNPSLISDADLLIVAASSVEEHIDLTASPLAETAETGGKVWTDENVAAVVKNVRERGMGFMSLHCSFYARNKTVASLLGVEPVMHHEVQPLWVHSLNQDHPVTQGIGKFFIPLDEQFSAMIQSEYTPTLFETTAMHDKRDAVGAWCREDGRGRVIGLLPGHTSSAYGVPEYREILWRSAHWAMKREIPPFNG